MTGALEDSAGPVAACSRCGAMMPGGDAGCWHAFHALLALEYSEPAYGAANLFVVDAHALQRPEDHGVKNYAFQLLRLCWRLEHDRSPRLGAGPHWLQNHFDGDVDVPALPSPVRGRRGSVTVADLDRDSWPDVHVAQSCAWAVAVWQAHHEWARRWMEQHRRFP